MRMSRSEVVWFLFFELSTIVFFAIAGFEFGRGSYVTALICYLAAALSLGLYQLMSVKYRCVPFYYKWLGPKFHAWFNAPREKTLLEKGEETKNKFDW